MLADRPVSELLDILGPKYKTKTSKVNYPVDLSWRKTMKTVKTKCQTITYSSPPLKITVFNDEEYPTYIEVTRCKNVMGVSAKMSVPAIKNTLGKPLNQGTERVYIEIPDQFAVFSYDLTPERGDKIVMFFVRNEGAPNTISGIYIKKKGHAILLNK